MEGCGVLTDLHGGREEWTEGGDEILFEPIGFGQGNVVFALIRHDIDDLRNGFFSVEVDGEKWALAVGSGVVLLGEAEMSICGFKIGAARPCTDRGGQRVERACDVGVGEGGFQVLG